MVQLLPGHTAPSPVGLSLSTAKPQ